MMYYLNKFVGFVISPIVIAIMGGVAALVCARLGRKCAAKWLGGLTVVWLWLWSTPMMYRWIGGALENEWPIVRAEDAPTADAIVLLGGGMGANTNVYPYAEMWGGADRVWHAARLYKAGKAPIVIPTGSGERESTLPLLMDLGVPESAVVIEDKARNTEENAKFVEKILKSGGVRECGSEGVPNHPLTHSKPTRSPTRVLLVTSAWHMRRSVLMYKKYAPMLEIIPAAADYEATILTKHPFCLKDILPDVNFLGANSAAFKEYIGYWGYRLFRR